MGHLGGRGEGVLLIGRHDQFFFEIEFPVCRGVSPSPRGARYKHIKFKKKLIGNFGSRIVREK
jgi:hypothetical protein